MLTKKFAGPSACQIVDITSHQLINPSTHQLINPSTHQSINPSSPQPINSSHQPIKPSTHQPTSLIPDMSLCMYFVMCVERAHGCLEAWEGGPVVPGPPPLGPWGASRGLPGADPGPMSACRTWRALLGFASKFMSILMSIFGRVGVDLGSLLWGHVGVFFGLSLSRNRFRSVLYIIEN